MRKGLFFLIFSSFFTSSIAEETDSLRHWGMQLEVNPCWVPTMDKQIKDLVKTNGAATLGLQFSRATLPADNDLFAADFGYPTFAFGLNYNIYNHVKLYRDAGGDLGLGKPVDYQSTLGNSLSAYASFERPFFRNKHWEADYAFNIGLGFSRLKYDKESQVDNLMISSNVLIFFGAGFHATYHLSDDWGIKAGVEFNHHSSGTITRPNKGSNTVGPMIGLVYTPYYAEQLKVSGVKPTGDFEKSKYLNFSLNVGMKTLYEDWLQTQFWTLPEDESYRTNDFKHYVSYAFQADYMSRYARRWASGIGLDFYYLSYMNHVRDLDKQNGYSESHSPFSLGISGKHEVFFHNISLSMSLGFYLFRQHGHKAKEVEQPFYETIGVKYHVPKWNNIAFGAYVRAHAFKADNTGLSISCPIFLKR